MKKGKGIIIIIFMALIMISLMGCSKESISSARENSSKVKEYNDLIAIYNKLALAQTNLAKKIDGAIEKSGDFEERLWKEINSQREAIQEQREKLLGFKFVHDDIAIIMDYIKPFVSDVDRYLEELDKFEKEVISKDDFSREHKKIYQDLLEKSSNIVKAFDTVYKERIIKK